MRITQYAIGILFASALAGCAPAPTFQPGSPEEARWQKLEMACIETGGISYYWYENIDGTGQWECERPENAIKIKR
jgi:hypothetical protein